MAKGTIATTDWGKAELSRIDKAVETREIGKGGADTLRNLVALVEAGAFPKEGYKGAADKLTTLCPASSRREGGHRATLLEKLPAIKDRLALHEAESDALDALARPFGLVVRVVINAVPTKDDAKPEVKGDAKPEVKGKGKTVTVGK